MEEKNQTSPGDTLEDGVTKVTIIEDNGGDGVAGNQEQSTEGTAGETKEAPEIDYKAKFAASTTEAQRLATELKLLQGEAEKSQGRYSTLETEKADMEKRFAEDDPEKYDAIRTKKEIGDLKQKMLLQEEKGAVDDYLESNPKAAAHKDSLKRLGRAFPGKSYEDLWNENFKPFVGEGNESVEGNQANKKSQPEKGDGTMSEMTSAGMTVAEFRKLPLSKRKAILLQNGGKL